MAPRCSLTAESPKLRQSEFSPSLLILIIKLQVLDTIPWTDLSKCRKVYLVKASREYSLFLADFEQELSKIRKTGGNSRETEMTGQTIQYYSLQRFRFYIKSAC